LRPAPLALAAAMLAFVATAFAQTPKLVTEEMMVPSEPGIEVYVRNKRPADMTTFRPERTVLFVHGATYPAETAFDLQLGGLSWMDYIASRGYDVYLVDVRGYGKSVRPKEMSDKPEANPPIVRGDTAVKDISLEGRARARVVAFAPSNLHELVGEFVLFHGAGRKMLRQHRAAFGDRGDEPVARPSVLDR